MCAEWNASVCLPRKGGPLALFLVAVFSLMACSGCRSTAAGEEAGDANGSSAAVTGVPHISRGKSPPVRAQSAVKRDELTESDWLSMLPAPPGLPAVDNAIPDLATTTTFLMPQVNAAPHATYSVTVTDAPLRDVLFALARDANLDIDIYPGIDGKITINAIDQTLPTILNRISEYAGLKYRIGREAITIAPDAPFRRNYKLDYILNSRKLETKMEVTTNVSSTGTGNNNSSINLSTNSAVDFWTDIVANLEAMLGPSVKEQPQRVILNRTAGIFSILATSRQHEEIQNFFDQIARDSQRQVFIEAAIVEVNLSDQYQGGVDWSMVRSNINPDMTNNQNMLASRIKSGPELTTPGLSIVTHGVLGHTDLTATVRMLSHFGNSKVLSSPRLTVMNNQAAVLRVTENKVYFEIQVTPKQETTNVNGTTATHSVTDEKTAVTIRTVPIGIILQVIPQISEGDVISLNIRPTIQRVSSSVKNPDPNFYKADSKVEVPEVPVVQVQEMDSTLRVNSGQLAVMGGLMENSFEKDMDAVPFLGKLPIVGSLFSFRNDQQTKKELIIFLRPTIIHEARDMEQLGGRELYESSNRGIEKDWDKLGVGPP